MTVRLPNLDEVIGSASQTATVASASDAFSIAAWAVNAAVRATERHTAIPLPVFLDVRTIWTAREELSTLWRSVQHLTEQLLMYQDWIVKFCDQCRVWFTSSDRDRGTKTDDWDLLPALVSAWPKVESHTAAKWNETYKSLNDKMKIPQIVSAWRDACDVAIENSVAWFCVSENESAPTHAGGLWSVYSTAGETEWLDATFDHDAARVYLDAEDPPSTAEQKKRIAWLQTRKRSSEFSRFADSFEEPNPFSGSLMLGTLLMNELGDHKIVNGTDIKISSNSPAIPPQKLEVHLFWAIGTSGLELHYDASKSKDNTNARVKQTGASLLQGIAALLFDDWRSALRELPINFHAHAGKPEKSDCFGRGGRRWRPSESDVSAMPPQQAVTRFFRRRDWTTIGSYGLGWVADVKSPPNQASMECHLSTRTNDWGFLAVLREDLTEFQFTEEADSSQFANSMVWKAMPSVLPNGISVVFVVDSPQGDGALYRVTKNRYEVVLTPVRTCRNARPDPSFLSLRSAALDLLLDALAMRRARCAIDCFYCARE